MKQYNTTYATSQMPLPENELQTHVDILHKMVQAAVSLEEFTIPLYMCSMYSLVGTHQITSKNSLYRGLWYPGGAISANPDKWVYDSNKYNIKDKIPLYESEKSKKDPNRVLFRPSNNKAFNLLYKIFIEEMLHLQMAANLAKILGINPSFTNANLVNKKSYEWVCFGKENSVIPYIVDLKDTKDYADVKVTLGALNDNQIRLFQAIEQPEVLAQEQLANAPKGKYFPDVAQVVQHYKAEGTLPLFGSIGHLYQTLFDFLLLSFDVNIEGQQKRITLLDKLLLDNDKPYPQRDLFNKQSRGHPIAEYSGFDTTLFGDQASYVIKRISKLINAITQQGEGSNVAKSPKKPADLAAVAPEAGVSKTALKRNYTSYDDEGHALPDSPRVAVRGGSVIDGFDTTAKDHYELFDYVKEHLMVQPDFMTWDQWHAKGNQWSEDLIKAKDYENNKHQKDLPKPADIAAAMCRLKTGSTKQNTTENKKKAEANYNKMCKVSTGAIWGIIHVLDKYWSADADQTTAFPYPAMGGTGDRMSICWSVFGKVPDLSRGLEVKERRDGNKVNHSCQGLAAMNPDDKTGQAGENDCAGVAMYHTCKGSNLCRAEGGCGFVQKIGGGGNCSQSAKLVSTFTEHFNCNSGKVLYSPPANNACGGQGGCAVPISASQLFPSVPKEKGESVQFGQMQLHNYKIEKDGKLVSEPFDRLIPNDKRKYLEYTIGNGVYDIAWKAFENVIKHRGEKVDDLKKPETNDIRLAFPPST
jgi:hypothetical protein